MLARIGDPRFEPVEIKGVKVILPRSRYVALALSPILLGAIWVHAGNGWVFSAPNGGWEYPLYLLVLSLVQALLGDGAYALSARKLVGAPLAAV